MVLLFTCSSFSLLQDIQHGQVMIDGIFAYLKRSLDGLTKPVSLYTVDS
jgi:hypothetical protein